MGGPGNYLRTLLPNFSGTTRATLAPDFTAGLTVAAIAVPQGIAYALIAGVPIEMGLWAAALPAVVAALFGSSPYLVTGPTQPVALVLGLSVVGPVVLAGNPVPVTAVLQIGLLAGLALAGFALAGLGRAARFLSDSVITGIVAGVGLLIAVGQIPQIAGMSTRALAAPAFAPQLGTMLIDAWRALGTVGPREALLAAGVPLVMLALRRVDMRIPGALIALGLAASCVQLLGWDSGPDAVATLARTSAVWPALTLPGLPNPAAVVPPAMAIALLIAVQSTAAARALARPGEDPVNPNRELFGQGAANAVAGLLGAMPASASFSRSSLMRSAGARSRLSAVVSGAIVLAVLPVVGELLEYLPVAALAGLVILTGIDLLDRSALRRAAATRGDAAVLIVTLVATLWIDVVHAVYAGLFLSLVLLVRRGGRLQMVEIVRAGGHQLREIPLDATTGTTPATVLHLEGDLNFAVAPELAERLTELGTRGVRVIILRLKRARHLDATVIEALRRVSEALQQVGTTIILCGLTNDLADLLRGSELETVLGPNGLLRAGPRLMEGYERAVADARERLKPLPDAEIFRRDGPARSDWSFEI